MTARSEINAGHFRGEGPDDLPHLDQMLLQDEVGGFARPHGTLGPPLFLGAGFARFRPPSVHVVKRCGLVPGRAVGGDDGKYWGHLAPQESRLANPGP